MLGGMAEPHATGVKWREWGEEAFAEAERRNAPILLDISAVWCHWCHVMDRTTYSDTEVARLIEEAVAEAKAAPEPAPAELTTDVYVSY